MVHMLSLKHGSYLYHVSFRKQGGLPHHVFMKKSNITKRLPTRTYFDNRDNTVKDIFYPEELWFTDVLPGDEIEENIHTAIEYIPTWTKIVIEKVQE